MKSRRRPRDSKSSPQNQAQPHASYAILASMTLASAHHATPVFDGLLYATVATVIPVLYLAITLQSTLYSRLLQVPDNAMRSLLTRTRIRPKSLPAKLIALCIMTPVFIAAWFILLYGVVGEIMAIDGLFSQSTSRTAKNSRPSPSYSSSSSSAHSQPRH